MRDFYTRTKNNKCTYRTNVCFITRSTPKSVIPGIAFLITRSLRIGKTFSAMEIGAVTSADSVSMNGERTSSTVVVASPHFP